MGTACHALLVVADRADGGRLLDVVVATVARLEACWSRFLPTSDVSRANDATGEPVVVGDETILAVEAALEGRRRTGGRFDPTVLRSVLASGYDRDFAAVAARASVRAITPSPARPAGAEVQVDAGAGTVLVAPGAGLDLGGIGKGLAADLAATTAISAGALGACVNLGGDLRAAGEPAGPGGWRVVVDDPARPAAAVAELALAAGGAATSSTMRRRWTTAGGRCAHHLIDPATGVAAATDVASVTVLAATAADAEVDATAAVVAGAERGFAELDAACRPAVLVTVDGELRTTAAAGAFLR
jgi:thiamine biosynthesis lipoprotein